MSGELQLEFNNIYLIIVLIVLIGGLLYLYYENYKIKNELNIITERLKNLDNEKDNKNLYNQDTIILNNQEVQDILKTDQNHVKENQINNYQDNYEDKSEMSDNLSIDLQDKNHNQEIDNIEEVYKNHKMINVRFVDE